MIDWLLTQSLLMSLLVSILLLSHRPLLNRLGAKYTYLAWFSLPVILLMSLMPKLLTSVELAPLPLTLFEVNAGTQLPSVGPMYDYIWWAWLTGASGLILFWTLVHITSLRKISIKPENGDISQAQHHSWINLLPKRVSLVQSSTRNSPMLLGLISPRLIIPCDFYLAYNKAQQKLIIEHELQHYARGDQLWNIIATAILALFWFNPLTWLAYRRFRQDQELSCDEGVLLNSNKQTKLNYSKALLICSAGQGTSQTFGRLSSHYSDSQVVKQRLESIQLPSRARPGFKYFLILFVGFSAMFSYANNKTASASLAGDPGMAVYPLKRIEPEYPLIAIQQKLSGHLVVSFDINRAGRVINAKIVDAQPAGIFEQSALVALAQWHYHKPGEVRSSSVRLDYRLNSAPALAADTSNSDIERLLVTD